MHKVETTHWFGSLQGLCALLRKVLVVQGLHVPIVTLILGYCATSGMAEVANAVIKLAPAFTVSDYTSGRTFRTPQAVCVDQTRGDIYVADTGNGRIVVFNSQGQFVESFNHNTIHGEPGEPVGVAVGKDGRIYVTDSTSHSISIYDYRGRLTGKITADKEADAIYGRITIDPAGNLYVVARNKGQVFVFGDDQVLKQKFGVREDKEGLKMISDVSVDANGRVYVVSSLGVAVRVYGPDGVQSLQFGEHAPGLSNVSFPTAIDVDASGNIWVTDSFSHSVKIYSESGQFLTSIGGFSFPVDLAFMPKENKVVVLEKSPSLFACYDIRHGEVGN